MVLVLAPDRLARHYAYQVVVIDEFTQSGCRVEFLNHIGGTSPEEQMLLQMQGVFAEYEWALIAERLRRGWLFAARQGRATWAQPPFGYTSIPKTATTHKSLLINDDKAEIVRHMYHWLVDGSLSSYAITQRLQEQHVPTRKGRGWWQSTVIECCVIHSTKVRAISIALAPLMHISPKVNADTRIRALAINATCAGAIDSEMWQAAQ